MGYSEFSGPTKLVIDALLMGEEVDHAPYLGFAPPVWRCRHFPPDLTPDSLVHDTPIPRVSLWDDEIALYGYPCPDCGKVYVTYHRRPAPADLELERWLWQPRPGDSMEGGSDG